MRRLFLISLCCVAWLPAAASGQRTFPYKASAVADDVYVRSGPGQNYYATDKLKRGQQVEVYRLDPGGWCAIRPIDGSFTWVSGRYLKPTRHNLAVVTEDGVAARVGTRFGDTRDVIQVRLHKGEVVAVLECAAQRRTRRRLVQDRPALGRVPLGFQQISRLGVSARRTATPSRRPPRRRTGRRR